MIDFTDNQAEMGGIGAFVDEETEIELNQKGTGNNNYNTPTNQRYNPVVTQNNGCNYKDTFNEIWESYEHQLMNL